jgi:hypothetical protein
MFKRMNRWGALVGWAALMAALWLLTVPRGLSIGTFILVAAMGPVVFIVMLVLMDSHEDTPQP